MIDFTKAALAARAEPVPPGTYDLRIASAEATTSDSGHTSLAVAGNVMDGPHKGRQIADSLMLASVDEQRVGGFLRRGLQMMAQLLDAVEASDEERRAAGADLLRLGRLLAGRTVRVRTGVATDSRDGTRRAIIVGVQPSPLDQVERVVG